MEKNIRTNPSEAQEPHNRPHQGNQQTEVPKEGEIRKVEQNELTGERDSKEEESEQVPEKSAGDNSAVE